MESFYEPGISREQLIQTIRDCQRDMDIHMSKALYYKYLAQQARSLISLHNLEPPNPEELDTISIDKKISKVKLWDNSMHPSLKRLKGKRLQKALLLFEKS